MDARMKHDKLLRLARDRLDEAHSADLRNRDAAEDDLRFLVGEQWRREDRDEREDEGKPCLTINVLPPFVRQVTGQIRDLNPSVRVLAADGRASKDVAEIYEGLIRHIEYQADAASIYEAAAESAAACGIGWWRVRTQYCDGDTFDQECVIERVHNPFAVMVDPNAKHPTRMDMEFAFIIDQMHRDKFADMYPKAKVSDITADHKVRGIHHWHSGENVVVAEYFWIEYRDVTIGMLETGEVVRDFPEGMNIVKRRTMREPIVKWAKITADEVLEGPTTMPGRYIPVFAVTGEEWHIGEEMHRSSVIRHAKDPQRLFNYARSMDAEITALQPKAPFLVTAKQVAGLEKFWNTANSSNRPYLPYNADEKAPSPSRVPPPVSSQGVQAQIQLAAEDLKRTTGIYEASLGARSNETSGVAIQRRQAESQNSTSVYADNMVKAVVQTGRVLVDMIPQIYDTERVVRILGEDDQEKMVLINGLMVSQDGEIPVNDLTVGKYDVRIQVGPTYATRKQEAADGMMDFLRVVPNAAAVTADLIAGMQDWPESERVAERLRKTLPDGMVEPDEQDDEGARIQQAAQAQVQQIMPMIQQEAMQQAAQEPANMEAQAKALKAQADAEKAQAEAQIKQLELAQMTGQIDAVIQQQVQAEIARALQGAMVPQGMV
jgi:hypothetical protein